MKRGTNTMTTTRTTTSRADEEEEGEEEEEEEEDGDCFFETLDRVSSSVSFDIGVASSGSDADDDCARASFVSAVAPPPEFRHLSSSSSSSSSIDQTALDDDGDYGVWMVEPLSIEERRRRLLQGMGLASGKYLASAGGGRRSRRRCDGPDSSRTPERPLPTSSSADATTASPSHLPSPSTIVRSRSDAGAAAESTRIRRQEEQLLGISSHLSSLIRSSSAPPFVSLSPSAAAAGDVYGGRRALSMRRTRREGDIKSTVLGGGGGGAALAAAAKGSSSASARVCTIKNLDTGKEFVIDELLEDGTWNRLSDPQTGLRLTIEEFERSLGYSPIVRELMRRANIAGTGGSGGSNAIARNSSHGPRSSANSRGKKKGIGWLKNIKGVANSVTGLVLEKERESGSSVRSASSATSAAGSSSSSSSSEWMKVRQHGKPYKELTGLYMCQEIQAHQGSIWSIRFSPDGQYLASAGEDRVIHVWKVLEGDTVSSSHRSLGEADSTFHRPVSNCCQDRPTLLDIRPSQRMRKGRVLSSRKRGSIPDYVVPGTVFSLSEKPICSFQGHLDDVLDLSWSKSQYLLSSSMDKTVRLWDMESKTCLKLFAHNDYVTCIQFNPVDDRYFISGSLDAKVRIWNIPDRQVVDWSDLHEMVTAACYTPDGQGALVGSHKGSCRLYSTSDGKLHQKALIDIQNKKRKSHAKKITGLQFVPGNPTEVLITSADSQIRVFDGVDLIHKFRGFRNTSSQISASFTADGNYVVCASEDSHVYIWKREEIRNPGGTGKGKSWITTRSHEHFHCKDVSVAIPWPPSGSNKCEPPSLPSWSRSHNHQPPKRSPDSQAPPSSTVLATEDVFVSCRSHCPPLPKKSYSEVTLPCLEEELHNPSRSGSGIGASTSISASHWLMSGALSSISAFGSFASSSSSSSSSRRYSGGSNRSSNIQAPTAWGLVVVTAGLRGEIKIYQNFGLPHLLSRQNHIF